MQKQVHAYQFFRAGPLPGDRPEKHSHMHEKIINQVLAIILLLISTTGLFAQDLGFQWVDGILGQAGTLGAGVASIDTDGNDNVYVIGSFRGTVDFDPGPGVFNLTSAGSLDPYICKYDPDGKLIWAKQFAGTAEALGFAISIAPDGSIYTGGYYREATDFDPGPGLNIVPGSINADAYITKLDGNGNFIWMQRVGDDLTWSQINGLSVGSDGSVIAAGEFGGTNNTLAVGSFNVTSAGTRNGLLIKMDQSGNFQWVKRIGGTSADRTNCVEAAPSGSIYIAGRSAGNTTGMASLAAGGFVIKLDTDGNTVWADLSADVFEFRDISLDVAGNIYAGGYPGAANLVKLNSSGVRQWAKTLGSNATNVSVGPDGYLYVAGSYSGMTAMGATTLTSNGGTDVYITKVDDAGNNIWAKSIGGPLDDRPTSILASQPNQLFVSGRFQQTVDFDPNGSTYELTSPVGSGGYSGFILKLSTPDLTLTLENSLSVLAVGASSDITVYIENIKAVATLSAVGVTISKPTASSGLVLSIDPSPDWTVTQTATQFTLTLVGNIAALDTRLFTAKLARTGGNAGTYNFTPVIANNAGGDTNNTNNRASVVFTKI